MLHRAEFPLADATRRAGVHVRFAFGRAVEDQALGIVLAGLEAKRPPKVQ